MIQTPENPFIGTLLATRYPFIVPLYQRTYAWEEEEVEDFIKDLSTLYSSRLNGHQQKHFFGGLVSAERRAPNTTSMFRFYVVDGQQRLATFVLTISLLVNALRSIESKAVATENQTVAQTSRGFADIIEESLLFYSEVGNTGIKEKLPRLTLSKADQHFYRLLINASKNITPTRESHARLLRARNIIDAKLLEPILSDPKLSLQVILDRLLLLRACILEDCQVIHIVSDDPKEAYKLFSTLNDRGRALTDGDLLRSITLEMLQNQSVIQDQVEQLWDGILAYQFTDIDRYLKAYYTSWAGVRAPNRDLYDHFRQLFFTFPDNEITYQQAQEIAVEVNDIRADSDLYQKLKDGEWPYDPSSVSEWEKDRLSRLITILKHTLCLPLLLSASRHLNETEFSKLIQMLERFAFRYINISRGRPEPLGECYYKRSRDLRKGGNANTVLATLIIDLQNLLSKNASDTVFEANLREQLRYSKDSTQRRLIKHFLTTLDDYSIWISNGASGKPQPQTASMFDINKITLEHVYPENAITPVPDLELIKNSLGNLLLLAPGENQSLQNKTFIDKKISYSKSKFGMARELAILPDWTAAELRNREDKLVNAALKIFQI